MDQALTRLGEISQGIARIQDLVVRLRTFSRLDEDERKQVNMRETVESVLTLLRHRFDGRIDIATEFREPALGDCYAGPLTQAIMNLVANATEAIEKAGTVSISCGRQGPNYLTAVTWRSRLDPAAPPSRAVAFRSPKPERRSRAVARRPLYPLDVGA